MTAPVLEQPLTPSPAPAPRAGDRRRRARWPFVLLSAVLAAAVALVAVLVAGGEPARVELSFGGDQRAILSDWGNEDFFGVRGSYILIYGHGRSMTLEVPWAGGEVTDAWLGEPGIRLFTTDGVEQADGVVRIAGTFGNCRYYHERELDISTTVTLVTADDREHELQLARPVLIHSPMLAACPDRTIDRQDDTRNAFGG